MSQPIILWLDQNASDPASGFRIKLGEAHTFTDIDTCVQYIESHPNKLIYFIVSGSFAKEIVPKIYESLNILGIYLFCGSISNHAAWAADYCDKMMIFDHGDDLLERLWNDFHIYLRDQATLCLSRAEEYKKRALQFRQPCG